MAEEEKKETTSAADGSATSKTSAAAGDPEVADGAASAEKPAEPQVARDSCDPHDASASDKTPDPKAQEPSAPDASASAKPAEKPAEPDWKTLYAVTLADFDNYKKRAARDREDTYRFAEADILKDVLPAVDNLQLALANAKEKAEDPFVKGVQLVHDTLLKALKDHGAEPFDCVGKELDTEKMEAIAHLPHDEIPEGKVSIESKRGWLLKGKVLRAAQVVVSAGKSQK
jgi:molecular chaperone GrpE